MLKGGYQRALTRAGFGHITTEIVDAPESGYCGLGGTGVACPSGLEARVTAPVT